MKRSLSGFKSRLFENDETTRNDVLEDISNSLANYLDAKRVKDFRIIIISYLFSVLPDFILQLSRFTSTKFRFQLSSSCFKFIFIAYTIILYQECRHTAFAIKRRK